MPDEEREVEGCDWPAVERRRSERRETPQKTKLTVAGISAGATLLSMAIGAFVAMGWRAPEGPGDRLTIVERDLVKLEQEKDSLVKRANERHDLLLELLSENRITMCLIVMKDPEVRRLSRVPCTQVLRDAGIEF